MFTTVTHKKYFKHEHKHKRNGLRWKAYVIVVVVGLRFSRQVVTERREAGEQQVRDANLERHLAQKKSIVRTQRRDVTQLSQHSKRKSSQRRCD